MNIESSGHQQHASQARSGLRCAVVTISDSRNAHTDTSGALVREGLQQNGHIVCDYAILPDEPDQIQSHVIDMCDQVGCDAVLMTGGTGIAPRDQTYEAIVELLDKRLDGFGELFRMLSHRQIGSAAWLSRAVAGIRHQTLIVSMPGAPAAVTLAMQELILPQLGHIGALLRTTQ